MVPSSPHKSSKTSQEHGEYNKRVTSPTNAQSNGQAECFVQMIKNSHTKSIEGGKEPHLAILSYITTPLNHSLPSPAELLNSRKYRCLLPIWVKQHKHTQQYRNVMQRQKFDQTTYYNQSARDLPSLMTGGTVYVQLTPNTRNWTSGLIIERINPRTYKVRTLNGGIYIRNRKFIRPRYTDSKQSLENAKGNTEPVDHTPQYHRPK